MRLKVGETIKRLRKEREITQEEFAEVRGVSCQSVSRWEKGTCYPDMELMPTIAGFFGISVDKLLGARTYKRDNWDMADSRPLRIILCEKNLAEPEFDTVREKPEFQETIKMLSE